MKSTFDLARISELFPYSFTYRNSKEPQHELPDHVHHFHEIIYVHSGNGSFFIHNKLYKMNKGDVFIIPNDTLHHAKPDKNDLISSSVIFFSSDLINTKALDEAFSYLSIIEKIKNDKEFKLQLQKEEQTLLELQLNNIHKELAAKQLGYIHASLLWTQQLILELSRIKLNQKVELYEVTEPSSPWLQHILTYIESNLNQNISVTTLAQEALISPPHFSRVFKQFTGMSPCIYINKKRILKSKEILLQTDHPIAYIAEKLGFESTPHFYRTFKKYVLTTPAKFRKENKESNIS